MVHARSALILELVELRHAVLKLNALLKLKHLLGLKLADDSNGILAIDLVTGMHKAVGKRAGGREEKKALGIEVKTAHGHPAAPRRGEDAQRRRDGLQGRHGRRFRRPSCGTSERGAWRRQPSCGARACPRHESCPQP